MSRLSLRRPAGGRPLKSNLAALMVGGCILLTALGGPLWLPDPLARVLIRDEFEREALEWETRIVDLLDDPGATLAGRIFGAAEESRLHALTVGSAIFHLTLFGLNGQMLWTSDADRRHRHVESEAIGDMAAAVRLDYAASAPGLDLGLPGAPRDRQRLIAHVTAPIALGGQHMGRMDYLIDVTDRHNAYALRLRWAIATTSGVALVFLLLTATLFYFNKRSNLREIQRNADAERDLMQRQIQLAGEVQLLGELNEWLQSSRSLDELFEMVSRFLTHMLPDCAGSVYVYSNSRDVLDGMASWNDGQHKDHIRPDECWGLRRGRTYVFGASEVTFICGHAEPHDNSPYFCFPILAHGETVGLLHLKARDGVDMERFETSRKCAQMCAEQVSLAIANVRMRDQLHDQSIRDPLTGLYNRRHMTEALRRGVDHARRARLGFSLLSVDVDHFKKFNDNHGHDAGDMVLRAVGAALEQHVDGNEVACRMGGEEFMLLLPDLSPETAAERAESLRAAVEKITVRYGEKNLPRITISIGLARYPDHGTVPQDLMKVADDALYEAKARGRNQVVVARLEHDLPAALPPAATRMVQAMEEDARSERQAATHAAEASGHTCTPRTPSDESADQTDPPPKSGPGSAMAAE